MRRTERGLTLIEILLALIVMVLGIAGILALFPAALESAKLSMQDTQAALLSESVANAVSASARFAAPTAGGSYQLTITHDSINSITGAYVYYQFQLPLISDNWKHHPASTMAGSAPNSNPEVDADWRLTGDPWTKAQFDAVKGIPGNAATGTDPSEPLDQFGYSFACRKINTLEYLLLPVPQINPSTGMAWNLAQIEPLVKLWEFRIHTFRRQTQGASFGAGTGTSVAGVTTKKLIATVTTRITVR